MVEIIARQRQYHLELQVALGSFLSYLRVLHILIENNCPLSLQQVPSYTSSRQQLITFSAIWSCSSQILVYSQRLTLIEPLQPGNLYQYYYFQYYSAIQRVRWLLERIHPFADVNRHSSSQAVLLHFQHCKWHCSTSTTVPLIQGQR